MKPTASQLSANTPSTARRLPYIYLAGKIRKHCWRHKLVYGLRDHSWDDGPLFQNEFVYIGPFFVGCDHGCFHNKNSHGAVAVRGDNACPGRDYQAEFDAPHLEVANLCLGALTKADLLFCFIDSTDCFGTIVEIGYALAHDVPVVIAIAPGVATSVDNDLWFACVKACWVIYDAKELELPNYLMRSIRRYT
jgi:hypothetical protein